MVTRINGSMVTPGGIGVTELTSSIADDLGVMPPAEAADYAAGTADDKALTPESVFQAVDFVELDEDETIVPDFGAGFNFTLTLTDDRELGEPVGAKVGQCGVIQIIQDGTGSRSLTFDSVWKFANGVTPTLSSDPGAMDLLSYFVLPGGDVFASLVEDVK